MRYFKIFILLAFFPSCLSLAFAQEESELFDAVKKYQKLQKDLGESLKNKIPDCLPTKISDHGQSYCSIKDFCSMSEIKIDNPVIYQNSEGELIHNGAYYISRQELRSCLKEKYKEDILEKKEELGAKLMTKNLKKMSETNQRLMLLTKKLNAGSKIQKISSRVLAMSLAKGINGETSDWEKKNVTRNELSAIISSAEKKEKITLSPSIKKLLAEIQFLKKDQSYLQEVSDWENALFPYIRPEDPYNHWDLLLNESISGGKKALEKNRAQYIEKSQMAFNLFKETQSEIVKYLESKKNESNLDSIERMIYRAKTIRFLPPRLTDRLMSHCLYPDAHYNFQDHSLSICPQLLNNPKISLIETIAHEISHSFDSCRFSRPMIKKKLPFEAGEAPFEVEIAMEPVLLNFENTLDDGTENPHSKTKIQEKAPYTDHPFSKTFSCLKDSKSLAALSLESEIIKAKTEKKLDEISHLGQNVDNNGKAQKILYFNEHQNEYLKYFEGCNKASNGDTILRSQLEEAFAEKISSEIVAKKLSSLSPREAQTKVLEIILSLGDVCKNEAVDGRHIRDMKIFEKCPDYFENMVFENKMLAAATQIDPLFNAHSEAPRIIEHSLLAHPDIRKALHCPKDEGIKYCE
jgi:hypothetical protein